MPRLIDAPTGAGIELGELVDSLETGGFDARDEDGLAAWGVRLKQLANNRSFLADLVIAELKRKRSGETKGHSAQILLLHDSRDYLIRANIWPPANDSLVRDSGTDPFFHGVAHDHNFSFLTVGYFGPGYWSDHYEYDHDSVIGYPGEKVDLRFVERSRLEPGKVMLYRRQKDVHLQLPADELSVSLNIVDTSHGWIFRDQYRFDLDSGTIAGLLGRTSLEAMLALAAHCGGEEGIDLLDGFTAGHPSERVRWWALRARAGAAPDVDSRVALFEEASRNGSRLVGEMAAREAARLEAGRAWIEQA